MFCECNKDDSQLSMSTSFARNELRSAIAHNATDECTQWRGKKKQKPKAFAHIFRFTRKVFSHQKTRKSAAGKCAFLNLASPLRSHAPESERQKTRKALPPPKSRRNRFRCAIQRTGENYRLRLDESIKPKVYVPNSIDGSARTMPPTLILHRLPMSLLCSFGFSQTTFFRFYFSANFIFLSFPRAKLEREREGKTANKSPRCCCSCSGSVVEFHR